MSNTDMNHMSFLSRIASDDVEVLRYKESTYRGSWKRRGGVGAFMMLARKWDRLESMAARVNYDVFDAVVVTGSSGDRMLQQGDDGTALAEIRDLRRYLLLVEGEMMARGAVPSQDQPAAARPVPAEDSNRHALQDEMIAAMPAAPSSPPVAATPAPAAPQHSYGPPSTLQEQLDRHAYLVATNAEASEWGAAVVSARAEEIKELDTVLERWLAPDRWWTSELDGVSPVYVSNRMPRSVVIKGSPDDPLAPRWSIVDRVRVSDDSHLEHLTMLRNGLNSTEFSETVAPWFTHMYKWDDARNEWRVLPRYDRWTKTGHR